MRWLLAAGAVFLLAPLALPDPVATDFTAILAGPSWAHPLGTDQLGRDVLSRLVSGGRLTLGLTAAGVLFPAVAGTLAGLVAGYLGRGGVARLADLCASLPTVLIGLLAAVVLGPGLPSVLVAVCAVGWTPFARQAYQLTVREAGLNYVDAARALGAGPLRIAGRHIAPNIRSPLVAHLCLRFAGTLLSVSGLSFLGLGVQPPTPEWGAMVSDGRAHLFGAPHLVLAPAIAVVLTASLATAAGRRLGR
ncbi:ABC transporter permease [Catenuloplanes atrovinosus]|uniref:Peptide/nickel transport system permease protein n=1 Tax=Catenuloplanes atrovinosus TaxID=137266 RepID=A0AAE3YP13_9ACTN|nr:ABC transporter permease [Catenuloplanes atrovinosus]MDR7276547.1 peptide/nickel transport system permease protein [Catenuloplanes atrovinosus]